jgi:hypothetical protein
MLKKLPWPPASPPVALQTHPGAIKSIPRVNYTHSLEYLRLTLEPWRPGLEATWFSEVSLSCSRADSKASGKECINLCMLSTRLWGQPQGLQGEIVWL